MGSASFWRAAKLAALGLAGAVALGAEAGAATLVDTGPGQSPSGLILDGDPGVGDWTQSWHAAQFDLDVDATITALHVWMSAFGPAGGGDLTMRIYNAGATLPGVAPALFSVTGYIANGAADWRGFEGLDWDLAAGSYWLSLEPAANSQLQGALWMQPASPLNHYAMNIRGYWEWDPQGREGPDQWGVRVQGVAAAVPEPSTWAVMIIGFGAVGAMARRARRLVAAT